MPPRATTTRPHLEEGEPPSHGQQKFALMKDSLQCREAGIGPSSLPRLLTPHGFLWTRTHDPPVPNKTADCTHQQPESFPPATLAAWAPSSRARTADGRQTIHQNGLPLSYRPPIHSSLRFVQNPFASVSPRQPRTAVNEWTAALPVGWKCARWGVGAGAVQREGWCMESVSLGRLGRRGLDSALHASRR